MNEDKLREKEFAQIIADHGGRLYRVGGCVRDAFLGKTPKDIDFCITGMVKKQFKQLFSAAEEQGKSFPVFRLLVDGVWCEAAFARTERKEGSGYKGFVIRSNPKVTIEEDLFRRDTTVNSIAVDCLNGQVVDPFQGRADIAGKLLRATSVHFAEDPVRALRLAGQAARLTFAVEQATLTLAGQVAGELAQEPPERLLAELTKVLTDAVEPGRFFQVLAAADLLRVAFGELAALPPTSFAASMANLQAVARVTAKPKLRFAVFGLELAAEDLIRWNQRMTLPGEWLKAALTLGKVAALLSEPAPDQIVQALQLLGRGVLPVEEFDLISRAVAAPYSQLSPFKAALTTLPREAAPPGLSGREQGQWIKQRQIEAVAKLL